LNREAVILTLVVLLPSALALALVTWRFRRKSAAQQHQLTSLYAVAEHMISATDPAEIYRRIVRTLPPMVDATHCYLMLYNRVNRQMEVLAGTDRFPATTVPMDSVSGPVTCFQNKALLEVPDAQRCPFLDAGIVEKLGQRSLLFVPMISEGEVLGVLEIDDRRRKRTFNDDQKASAQHVANLGALAMKLC
jgi:GAF domain-containing protein